MTKNAIVETLVGAPPAAMVREASGLECAVGRARIAIPTEAVAQIIEYEVAELPLARNLVAGLGLFGDQIIVSVSFAPRAGGAAARRRTTKGVLLHVPEVEGTLFAMEVVEVHSFVRLTLKGRTEQPGKEPLPRWITLGETSDGRALGLVDVPSMVRELSTPDGQRAS